jgi:hypothetical protein
MNSVTKVGLPIVLVVGLVFGITFIRMYSTEDTPPVDTPKEATGKTSSAKELPVRFGLITAAAQVDDPPAGSRSLKYWDPIIEVGVPGHFEFWCQSRHPEPVIVRISEVNCQCAGVEVAPVRDEDFREYAVVSALAGSPLGAASGPTAAIAHAILDRRLNWLPLLKDHEKTDQTIAPADPAAGTRMAIVRLGWEAKNEPGPKTVSATLVSRIGESAGTVTKLEAQTVIVPAFDLVRRDGPAAWVAAPDLPVGELRENGEVRRTVYLLSATRKTQIYSMSIDRPDPCISWTEAMPATPEEVQSLLNTIPKEGAARRPKSVYKIEVTVHERVEAEVDGKKQLRQMDLGLIERRLTVAAVNGGSIPVALRGRVIGDVSFLSGTVDGRIDLGNSFPADQDWTKDVALLAERTGLDLTLDTTATTPSYLKVKLDALAPIDGRNHWRLRVTVPKGSVYSAIPEGSAIVLNTTGPNPRRLRIPIRGIAYDRGTGPKL